MKLSCWSNFLTMERSEYRAMIKFIVFEDLSVIKILAKMVNLLKESIASFSTLSRWSLEFRRGRTSIEDDPRTYNKCPNARNHLANPYYGIGWPMPKRAYGSWCNRHIKWTNRSYIAWGIKDEKAFSKMGAAFLTNNWPPSPPPKKKHSNFSSLFCMWKC